MRKLVLIALMIQVGTLPVFAGGLLTELFRVPDLVDHYYDHQEEDHNLSFLSFLNQHYLDVNSHPDEHDHQLPFKSTDAHIVMVFSLAPKCEVPTTEFEMASPVYPMPVDANLVLRYTGSIFQPPKK
jgi:hypothetical protein